MIAIPVCIWTSAEDVPLAINAAVSVMAAGGRPTIILGPDSQGAQSDKIRAAGIQCKVKSAPRNGNLNGPSIVREILMTLQDAAAMSRLGMAMKMDADCIAINLDAFLNTPMGFNRGGAEPAYYGCAYAYGVDTLRVALEALDNIELPEDCPEDITIWRLAGSPRSRTVNPVVGSAQVDSRGVTNPLRRIWAARYAVVTFGSDPAIARDVAEIDSSQKSLLRTLNH